MINILIADDHEVVIRGLRDILESEFSEVNIGDAKCKEEIYESLHARKWDLILLDIIIPGVNVIELLGDIRRIDTKVPILILTALAETEYAVSTLKAGANGYITKGYAADELAVAVHKVIAGETYLSDEALKAITSGLRDQEEKNLHATLSSREMEVFCSIAQGKTVKEIAYDLCVSAKTVSTYIARIKEKTGLTNYVDFTRYAIRHKLVD